MEFDFKRWNTQHKKLRELLADPMYHDQAVNLFLRQHAAVHSTALSTLDEVSYLDEITLDLDDENFREIPTSMGHSIAWILWHLARIEDVTMNILVKGGDQVIIGEKWVERMGSPVFHTGNGMTVENVRELSRSVDVGALKAYRLAVGQQTEKIVISMKPGSFSAKVDKSRLDRLIPEGAVAEQAGGLVEYWSRRDIAGFLLMPPTRHCIVHLNEAASIKKKITR